MKYIWEKPLRTTILPTFCLAESARKRPTLKNVWRITYKITQTWTQKNRWHYALWIAFLIAFCWSVQWEPVYGFCAFLDANNLVSPKPSQRCSWWPWIVYHPCLKPMSHSNIRNKMLVTLCIKHVLVGNLWGAGWECYQYSFYCFCKDKSICRCVVCKSHGLSKN